MKKLLIKASAVILLTGMGFGTMNHVQAAKRTSLKSRIELRINNIRDSFKDYTNDDEAKYYLRLALSGERLTKVLDDYREECLRRYEINDTTFSNY
ncbi:Uncharacterised protein [Streptococcus dysgalactiae]|nr:Uncharacterised protein [Streptococcus dysgalactiae]